jgi:CubicO group peptidase (beta-lactamase class C family)
MNAYRPLIIIFLGVFFLFGCNEVWDEPEEPAGGEPIAQTAPTAWREDYAGYVQQTMAQDGIPGVALALVQGDEIVWAEGYGLRNVAQNAPVTPDTLFHIGSTHKSMTAMVIATLVDDGVLTWDTPIVRFAPQFALSDREATQQVTMRHLLSMSSGIPDDAEDELDDGATIGEVFEIVKETELLARPGEVFSYSNISCSVAGYLGVMAAGGQSDDLYAGYAHLLQTKVLDPIGMNTATIYAGVARRDVNYAQSYVLSGRGEPVLSPTYDVDGDVLAPSGSLKATVREMALYVATQLNRGVAPNGRRVVSAESLAETWEPYLDEYGMGWQIETYKGVELIFHTGAYDDFASVIGFVPEFNVGFVLLLNSEEAGERLVEEAAYALVDVWLEQE